MIVVDTSALMAVLLDEPEAGACIEMLAEGEEALLSAGTLTEALIVANHRGIGPEMGALIADIGLAVIPVAAAEARLVALAHARWGRGIHPAGLNFGDCFAYALARERNCPLLYVGQDFKRTDVEAALDKSG